MANDYFPGGPKNWSEAAEEERWRAVKEKQRIDRDLNKQLNYGGGTYQQPQSNQRAKEAYEQLEYNRRAEKIRKLEQRIAADAAAREAAASRTPAQPARPDVKSPAKAKPSAFKSWLKEKLNGVAWLTLGVGVVMIAGDLVEKSSKKTSVKNTPTIK